MSSDKKMVSKSCILALAAVWALGLCEPRIVVAQAPSPGNANRGMFGNRTLGQSFVPRPSTFGGGIQTGPSGNFLSVGRTDGSAAFATPWRRNDEQAATVMPATQPAANIAPAPQTPVPEYNLPELSTLPEVAPPSFLETNGWDGTSSAEQTLGMPVGIGLPAASNVTIPRVDAHPASASAVRPQPYTRSPELSDRLTEIARVKGMLAGQAIDVYLGNDVAVLKGTVRTPGARVLLASVLGLEPEVRKIENRLIVGESATLSSNAKSR